MNALARRLSLSFKPALIHLGLSALVAAAAMSLIFLLWYPGALAGAQGVSRLVMIMIVVDVVIGPLITLIVYAPGKKSLLFDLMVVAAMQTVALLYGLKAIESGRPAYVVFNVDRFDVIAVKEVLPDSLERAAPELQISWLGPKWAVANLPADPAQRSQILFSAVSGGADLPQMPEFFVPMEGERPQMLKRLHPLEELRKLNSDLRDDAAWQGLLDGFGKEGSELGYLPMAANARDGAVILDAKTGEVLGIRLLTPGYGAPPRPDAALPVGVLQDPRGHVEEVLVLR